MTKPCPWCEYDLTGLEGRIRRCPECGKRPYRRSKLDACREQLWPAYEPGNRRSAFGEVLLRRIVTIALAAELLIALAAGLLLFVR